MHTNWRLPVLLASLAAAGVASADYDLTWHTVDGGGAMSTTSSTYDLSGTVGQPDAGFLAGGNFEVAGGFWPAAVAGAGDCLPGDANCDGAFDGADIDPFFVALGDPGTWQQQYPDCDFVCTNDMNGDNSVDGADIDDFFVCLANGGCP